MTFEEKIAYEIGYRKAQAAYLEKEASMQAVKAFGSGLKGVVTGQGTTMGQAFQAGAGGQGFRQVMGNIGSGLAQPWKQLYTKGVAKNQQRIAKGHADKVQAAKQKFRDAKGVDARNAARVEREAAMTAQRDAKAARNQIFGGDKAYQQAHQQRIFTKAPNTGAINKAQKNLEAARAAGDPAKIQQAEQALASAQQTTLNYGNIGTMAAGVGLAGAGGYAAFGGGDPAPQPQVAPHQYYLNQLRGYFS